MKLKVYSYAYEPHYRLQPNLAWRISKQLTAQLYASFPHGLRLTYPACNLWRMHSNSCPRLGSAPNWVHSARAWATNHHHFFSLSLLLIPLLPAKNLSTTIFFFFYPVVASQRRWEVIRYICWSNWDSCRKRALSPRPPANEIISTECHLAEALVAFKIPPSRCNALSRETLGGIGESLGR